MSPLEVLKTTPHEFAFLLLTAEAGAKADRRRRADMERSKAAEAARRGR